MKSRWLTIVLTLVLCFAFAAGVLLVGELVRRASAGLAGLKNPDSLILYAIDGAEDAEAKYAIAASAGEEVFHQYAVLGKVEITDPAERSAIVAALQQAVVWPDAEAPAGSFQPRHALRARENGQTIDIAICFPCRQYHRYGEGPGSYSAISKSAEPVLNRYLQGAGVSLAP
jgi:hypothetical protein